MTTKPAVPCDTVWTDARLLTMATDTGTTLSAKSWLTEAPLRMLMNNLHPDVAERPEELVVYSQHSGRVIVADGTPEAAARLGRVLWNDPATGVMRHADAGYDIALDCAREKGLDLPGILG